MPPTSIGRGTWKDITPSGITNITTERNINLIDTSFIIFENKNDSNNSEFECMSNLRALRISLDIGNGYKRIWEGVIDKIEYQKRINLERYKITCFGYGKYLKNKKWTKSWSGKTFDQIFSDIAKNAGIPYGSLTYIVYDTSKLYGSTARTQIAPDISINETTDNLYDLILRLCKLMQGKDDVAYEYAFSIDPIQTSDYCYLLPDILYTDNTATTFYESDLESISFTRDMDVINWCKVQGEGYETEQIGITLKVATQITTSPQSIIPVRPTTRSYAIITMEGTSEDKLGAYTIDGYDAVGGNPLSEENYGVEVKANSTVYFYTKERYADWHGTYGFTFYDLIGVTVTIRQIDRAIAGKSINDFGLRQYYLTDSTLNTQNDVNRLAHRIVLTQHKPKHTCKIIRTSNKVTTTDYINKVVLLKDPFYKNTTPATKYLITNQKYIITENDIKQELIGIHINYDWE